MAEPLSPPCNIASGESSCRPPFFLSPWHERQFSTNSGRIRFSKNSIPSAVGGRVGCRLLSGPRGLLRPGQAEPKVEEYRHRQECRGGANKMRANAWHDGGENSAGGVGTLAGNYVGRAAPPVLRREADCIIIERREEWHSPWVNVPTGRREIRRGDSSRSTESGYPGTCRGRSGSCPANLPADFAGDSRRACCPEWLGHDGLSGRSAGHLGGLFSPRAPCQLPATRHFRRTCTSFIGGKAGLIRRSNAAGRRSRWTLSQPNCTTTWGSCWASGVRIARRSPASPRRDIEARLRRGALQPRQRAGQARRVGRSRGGLSPIDRTGPQRCRSPQQPRHAARTAVAARRSQGML